MIRKDLAERRRKLKSRAYHNREKVPTPKASTASLEAVRRSHVSQAEDLAAAVAFFVFSSVVAVVILRAL